MPEDKCECSMMLEFGHLKDDIIKAVVERKESEKDIKDDVKELGNKMIVMTELKIRTEIALEDIKTTQISDAKKADDNHEAMLLAVSKLKNGPKEMWAKLGFMAKSAVIGAVATYTVGTIFGFVRAFTAWYATMPH